ncbi:MAG: transporter [Calditrichaceae bacterium]
MKVIYLLLVVFLAATCLYSQSPYEMNADRPDVTESAYTVLKSRLQIETGFLLTNDTGLEVMDIAGTLFRYGLSRSLEFRAGAGFRRETETIAGNEQTYDGLADVSVGIKVRVFQHIRNFPDAAVILSGTLPVGREEFRPNRFEPKAILALAHKLNRRLSMGYNFGGYWPDGVYLNMLASASLGIWIAGPFSAFVEGYAESPHGTPTEVLLVNL